MFIFASQIILTHTSHKSTMKKTLTLVLMLTVSLNYIFSAKEPMKYGKIDKADLEMTVYPADSSASAVILCNYGYFNASDLQFVHQMRIKILKEEGKQRGNFYVPAAERTNVKGQTVNIENGKPVVTKLSNDGIFIEKITKGSYRARVAMPNVKVGSVIDVEFYYPGLPSYWSFQEVYPVRWSELVIEQNINFSFRKNFTGYAPLSESSNERWVAKDVPAFKTEPYINNYENYLTRFNIELSSIHVPGYLYKDFATDWKAVAKILREDDDFGGRTTNPNFFLNSIEKQIKQQTKDPQEQIAKAYEEIQKVKWNNESSLTASKEGLTHCYNKKIGNSADINLMLISLLRKLDIQAYPVAISTRDNGVLPPFSVSLDKLNYVLVQAIVGENVIYMDATEEFLPLGILPERTLNGKGLVIRKDDEEWVDLSPVKKNKQVIALNLKLTPDGTLKGDYQKSFFDYAALKERIRYKKFNDEESFLKSVENKFAGLSIDKFNVYDADSTNKPIKEEFSITLKNAVTKANNQLFVNPLLLDKYEENPFKVENRLYPVDFTTSKEQVQVYNLEIPTGYSVEKLPENIKMTLPENSGSFLMQSSVTENNVQVLFKLLINKPVFYQQEYPGLRTFFDELVKKQSEMIIIKKDNQL